MRIWYCYVGGVQYGPVHEETLRQWVREGRIHPAHYLWTPGMAAWAPAGYVQGLFAGYTAPPAYHRPAPALPPPPGGTGGKTPNRQITARARKDLRKRWGGPIAFCFLLGLMKAGIMMVPLLIGAAINFILAGPFFLGKSVYFLSFARRGHQGLGMMFSSFRRFAHAVAAQLLRSIFVSMWAGLAGFYGLACMIAMQYFDEPRGMWIAMAALGWVPGVVAGIIAAMSYSQTMFLLADHKSLQPLAAIRLSSRMMRGRESKLLWIWMRFSPWYLLCYSPFLLIFIIEGRLLALGLAVLLWLIAYVVVSLWLDPYLATSLAEFYDDLRPPAQAQGEEQTQEAAAPTHAVSSEQPSGGPRWSAEPGVPTG